MAATKRRVILLMMALGVANVSPAGSQSVDLPWYATAAIGAHAGAHAFDLVSTGLALTNNPDATESNPLLRPFVNHLPVLAAVDIAVSTATNYGLWRMAKTHPRRAAVLAIGLSAVEVALGRHNLAVAHRRP